MDVCAAVLINKISVSPVHYIWIFVRPDKLVLRVDRLYKIFFTAGNVCCTHACTKKYLYILCGYFTGVSVLDTYLHWFLCCFNSTAVFTVDCHLYIDKYFIYVIVKKGGVFPLIKCTEFDFHSFLS